MTSLLNFVIEIITMAIKDLLTFIFYRQIMVRLLQTACTTLLVLGLFSTAFSQPGTGQSDDAEINSTANVLSQITVSGDQDLNFGDVSPGVNKAISYDDVNNAGQFTVSAGADANWEEANDSADPSNGSNEFDPSSNETINEFPSNDINVYLGGQVEPTNEQSSELYKGTITLSATYN